MSGGVVTLGPFHPLDPLDEEALGADAADVARYLGTGPVRVVLTAPRCAGPAEVGGRTV